MNFAGIITEYDPFHNGHALQLAQLRQKGAGHIAVCMSAGAVQRGGVPLLPESVRAQAALLAGADLVVALPAPYANAGAEAFAAAGVHLLAALGCDTLAFGAEDPDAARLMSAAELLDQQALNAALRRRLATGQTFAAARAAAAESLAPGSAALLAKPNNILGIEYCKAIRRQKAAMTPLPLLRRGAGHGAAEPGRVQGQGIASAGFLRKAVATGGIGALEGYVPSAALDLYRQSAARGELSDPVKFDTALLALLRSAPAERFGQVRGVSEGLEHRLAAAVRRAATAADLYDLLKTKRYPHARLRRLALDAALDVRAGTLPDLPPFVHVLGARRGAMPLLQKASVPAAASLARLRDSLPGQRAVFDMYSAFVDFSALCRRQSMPMGLAYTCKPMLL